VVVWDQYSDEEDVGGTVIAPEGLPPDKPKGRWKRQFEDPLSVKWFGAKGEMKEYYIFKDKDTDFKKHMRRVPTIISTYTS
jgi:hypothetical protein